MAKPLVLVVDDELTTRRLVAYTLKTFDLEVLGADDAVAALELVRHHTPNLIIVDINLPGMDGFTLMERLGALPHLRNVPMVAYTGRTVTDDAARARKAGARGFLFKPFSTSELRSLVNLHLGLEGNDA
jgi:two-component system, chemotaxis family, chemotaxis protein CheY